MREETMDHVVECAKDLKWPVVILIIVLVFRGQLNDLLKRLSGFTIKTHNIKFGLTLRKVQDVAQELFKEVSDGLRNLTEVDRKLFAAVRTSNGNKTVDQITLEVFGKSFERRSDEHDHFRALRDSQLIRPTEGNRWEAGKHPMVTPYAEVILKAKPNILAVAKLS
jgi:hypothetical protein